MKFWLTALVVLSLWLVPHEPVRAADTDVVTFRDGSVLRGEIIELKNGELRIKTTFGIGDPVKVKWETVESLSTSRPLPFHLREGTVLVGTAEAGKPGVIQLRSEPFLGSFSVPLDQVSEINPLVQPPVIYQGAITAGLSAASGNSHLRNASFLAEVSGRSESLRLILWSRYIYSDEGGRVVVRNGRGTLKLDFFITKRFYWFASSYFEQDTFQDLKLRTSLSSGPGYQVFDVGDFTHPLLRDLNLFFEGGLAYFNEDFQTQADKTSIRGRSSIKLNWPLFDERVTIYHFQEFFPSLQDFDDFFLTFDQGIRLKLLDGLVANFQLTYRYNNNPPPGIENADVIYLITFGYNFDTTRKRL